jgi:phosphoglycerol transferase MdoB-like AlkP superfamily enzyme
LEENIHYLRSVNGALSIPISQTESFKNLPFSAHFLANNKSKSKGKKRYDDGINDKVLMQQNHQRYKKTKKPFFFFSSALP